MKILICAVPFSPNLGDGAIFESIKSRYEEIFPSAQVLALDIAGRTQYQTSSSNLNRLRVFPKPLRRYAVLTYCTFKYITAWKRDWHRQIQAADVITIGGGQLFLDEELNFPTKLYLLSRLLKDVNKKKNIAFVGASSHFSLLGKILLSKALKNINPDSISVRDIESRNNIIKNLVIKKSISVAPDPALYFEENRQPQKDKSLYSDIAICISSPQSLDAEGKLGEIFHKQSMEFYCKLIKQIYKKGMSISLFSNGAPEDEQLKIKVHEINSTLISHCHPSPLSPKDLVHYISKSSVVIAHRLHANIIAYSLGIPSIGLNWDSKVKSFFAAVQRMEFYIDEINPSVEKITETTAKALRVKPTFLHKTLNNKIEEEISTHLKSTKK